MRGSHPMLSKNLLTQVHSEIEDLAELLGLSGVEVAATHGVLRILHMSNNRYASPADTALRFGQLFCRWCAEKDLDVSCGVHLGSISTVTLGEKDVEWVSTKGVAVDHAVSESGPQAGELEGGTRGYFGSAIIESRLLADAAPAAHSVHMWSSTKNSLKWYEQVPFCVRDNNDNDNNGNSYYLDAWVEITENKALGQDDGDEELTTVDPKGSTFVDPKGVSLLRAGSRLALSGPAMSKSDSICDVPMMNIEELSKLLTDHGLDVQRFGRGQAIRLVDFHAELKRKKSYLVTVRGKLERRMNW